MILTLYVVLAAVSLVLIVVGLVRPSESAQAVVGFTLMFILSMIILGGGLEYQKGVSINTSLTYTGDDITSIDQEVNNEYTAFNDATSHTVGWYLTIASVIGLAGVFWSIKRSKNYD